MQKEQLGTTNVTEKREIAENRFQRLFETARDGIVVIDVETGTLQDVNPFFLELTGFQREDFIGRTVAEAGALLGLSNAGDIIPATRELEIVRYEDRSLNTRDGRRVVVDIVGNRYRVGAQPVIQLNIRDLSVRKEAARALKESEDRFRVVVESVRDYAIFQLDGQGLVVTWNTGAERLLGWKEEEIVGRPGSLIFTTEDLAKGEAEREMEIARVEGRARHERWHVRKDGSRFFASGVLSRAADQAGGPLAFTKVMQDITARKEQEAKLRRSLEEKNLLVSEIHHRVKNNLQMIVSLLNLQARNSDDPRVLSALHETQGRVRAIAHIHENLYASDDLSEVEIGGYLTALAKELIASHTSQAGAVVLEASVTPLVLHVERAIPLALVANELILNSLKHGLISDRGTVKLTFAVGTPDGDNWARLSVEDGGPGVPAEPEPGHRRSMGLRLVNLLVRQLRGRLEVENLPGARVSVLFPVTPRAR